MLVKQAHDMAQQQATVNALVTRVSVGEVVTDVPEGSGTQQGITQGMDGDVGIAVTQQTFLPGDINSSEPQFTALDEPMNVKTHSNA